MNIFKLNGQVIKSRDLGTNYPTDWLETVLASEPTKLAEMGITVEDVPIVDSLPPTLDELKEQKVNEINFAFKMSMNQIKSGYPQDEILTWAKQESEARAYVADSNAETPLLDGYVQSKAVPKALLAAAIIAKADIFATISGQSVGKRQQLEDVINAATAETISAIVW